MANIPTWAEVYGTPQQYREHMDAHTKAHQKFLEAQKKPGYIPAGMRNWVLSGLPKNDEVRNIIRYAEINRIPLDDAQIEQLFKEHNS